MINITMGKIGCQQDRRIGTDAIKYRFYAFPFFEVRIIQDTRELFQCFLGSS